MRRQREYVDINNIKGELKEAIGYYGNIIEGLYLSSESQVYGKDENGYYIINPYLNTCHNGTSNWKYGYYKFRYNKVLYNLHWMLARVFVPGYQVGLVADHIDNDSRNNNINNLHWITRSENTLKYWNSLSENEIKEFKEKYSEAIKKAHENGHYKDHLNKLHNKED